MHAHTVMLLKVQTGFLYSESSVLQVGKVKVGKDPYFHFKLKTSNLPLHKIIIFNLSLKYINLFLSIVEKIKKNYPSPSFFLIGII